MIMVNIYWAHITSLIPKHFTYPIAFSNYKKMGFFCNYNCHHVTEEETEAQKEVDYLIMVTHLASGTEIQTLAILIPETALWTTIVHSVS